MTGRLHTNAAPQGRGPLISVVVVNYNGGDFLPGALASLQAQIFGDFEVIVVDNASTDGSLALVRDWAAGRDNAQVVEAGGNIGFAAGANLGARQARGEWLAMLNPDAQADPDWLSEIAAGIAAHPSTRCFASTQLLAGSGREVVDGAGDCLAAYGFAWRAHAGQSPDALPGTARHVFTACGASAAYHRETFRALGGFDERFFCYLEDVDLGYRMQRLGHDCVWLPRAVVRHADGGISASLPGFRQFHTARNRVWVLWKNTPAILLVPSLAGWALMSALLGLKNALVRNGEVGPMLRGYRAGLAALPERRARGKAPVTPWTTPLRMVSLWTLLRRMSWSPWAHRARAAKFRPIEDQR